MDKKKYYLIMGALFFEMLMFNTCKKKDNQINFSGKVINPGTNEGIGDAIVSLSSTSVQSWVYNSNFQDIATINSSADGTFNFKFEKQAASAYRLYIYKSNYFPNTTIINATDVTEAYNNSFELFPEATITLKVKNTTPLDSADRILYRINKGAVVCTNGCPEGYINGIGANYDTTITCKTYGNMYFLIESNITKGANTIQRKDSIYLNPFVTSELNIFY